MRNPERIDKVLAAISEVWKRYPDLRFGQLISNVFSEPTLYFIEDDELIEKIKRFYDE